MSEDLLKNFSKNDTILKFDENGEVVGAYQGATEQKDPFSKTGETQIRYTFMCKDGKQRFLDSKSKRLAKAIYESGADIGDTIEIIRFGEGFETTFRVKVVDTKKKPVQAKIAEVEPLPFNEKPAQEQPPVSLDDF